MRSFEEIYDEYVDYVYRRARRLGVDEGTVDDIVQEVFLVVYRRHPECSEHVFMKAWLGAVLLWIVREHRRTTRRKSPHVLYPTTDPETVADARQPGPYDALALVEAARMFQACVDELDTDKREAFLLSELEQLTLAEIAEVVGINPNTAYSRVRAARQAFDRAVERFRQRDTWRLR
jgi:RNA polymerase sigma-70 factor, ECF subfamily